MINRTKLYAGVWLALLPFAAAMAQDESAAEPADALQQQVQTLQRENEALRAAQAQLQSEIDGYLDELTEAEEAQSELTGAQDQLQTLQRENEALRAAQAQLQSEIDGYLDELTEAEETQSKLAEAQDQLQKLDSLQRENEALRAAQAQLQSEIDGYLDQLAETEEAYSQAAESARKAQAGIDALKKALNRIRDERDQLAVELKQTKEAQDRKVQATINALKSTLNRVRNERDELATELGQAKAEASSAETGKQYYTVKLGDTLTGIAIEFYGNGYLWPKLLEIEANRAVIANPNHLEPGIRLIIPDIAK